MKVITVLSDAFIECIFSMRIGFKFKKGFWGPKGLRFMEGAE
jgi:hypothetical protein